MGWVDLASEFSLYFETGGGGVHLVLLWGRDFFCVPQGPFMGPCPNAKYPNFSQFDQKNSQSESKC